MKTSSKIFLGSLGLLGIGLLIYDLQLNAAFRTGDYTKPFYNYEQRAFANFDRIRLNSATALNVLFVQGDYKVLVEPRASDVIDVRQDGRQLVITAHFPYRFQGPQGEYAMYVSCPDLKNFETTGQYFMRNHLVKGKFILNPWIPPTVIRGFTLDSANLTQEDGGNLVLENDRIGALHATVGSGSSLTLNQGNAISGGDISVLNNGKLTLQDTTNLNVRHHLADSATLVLSGTAAKQLLKINQP